MSLTLSVIKGVLWSGASQVARRGTNLLVTIILARLLSPDTFGLVALATMFVGLANLLCDLGFSSALVQKQEVSDDMLSTSFWLSLLTSLVLSSAAVALAAPVALLYHEPRVVGLLRIMPLSMPVAALGQISGVLLQRRLAFRQMAMIDFAGTLTSGAVGIGLAWAGFGVWALIGQTFAANATTLLGRLIAAPWRPRLFVSLARARELGTFGLSVIGGTLVNFAGTNVDNALVGGALGTASLGVYALAYNLAVLPGATVGGLVSGVMFPTLTKLQADPERYRRGYLRTLRVVATGTLPLIAGMWAVAPLMVTAVYGSKWSESATVLRRLLMVALLQGINISGNVFYSLGRPGLIFKWALLSLVCMSGALALGVRHGIEGITIAYTLVAPVVLFGPHVLANRLMSLRWRDFMAAVGPATLSSFFMATLVSLFVHFSWVPGGRGVQLVGLVALGALTYLLLMLGIARWNGVAGRGFVGWALGQHMAPEASEASAGASS